MNSRCSNQLDQYDQYGKYASPIPMSQQMMSQNLSMSNMRQSFATPNTLIDKPDFINKGGVMHNNLGDKLLSEHVIEYKIHITSADRDTAYYPSPFNMKIPFGSGLRSPFIPRKFENVKYVTLDSLVLPRVLEIDTSQTSDTGTHSPYLFPSVPSSGTGFKSDGKTGTPTVNNMNVLTNRRFLIVKIVELSTNRTLGTSTLFDRDTFVIVPDYDSGLDNWVWKPLHNSRVIYQNSLLHNISELSFLLLDENGNVLTLYDGAGNNILTTTTINLNNQTYTTYVNTNSGSTSVAYTNGVTQVWYNLTFGVIENELTTTTSYK
jgi:hypothetical protein